MRIFVAGASGTIGGRLVPQLVAAGHEVVGTTRSAEKTRGLEELGARPVVVDALDEQEVRAAVRGAEPEVVIHQLTALDGVANLHNFDKAFANTNRLRTQASITCCVPPRRSVPGGLSRRATPVGRTSEPAGR